MKAKFSHFYISVNFCMVDDIVNFFYPITFYEDFFQRTIKKYDFKNIESDLNINLGEISLKISKMNITYCEKSKLIYCMCSNINNFSGKKYKNLAINLHINKIFAFSQKKNYLLFLNILMVFCLI